jgi:putative ABC transport system permease protein
MRQAAFIALGLALGVGLVITVTAAAAGVQDAQAAVLHSLYGVGTDVTITQPPRQGSGGGTSFGFQQQISQLRAGVKDGQVAAGTKISVNDLTSTQYGTLTKAQLAAVGRQRHVTGAAGGLALADVTVNGTVPALQSGAGTFSSSFTTSTFTVDGTDLRHLSLGPLSAATVTSGRDLGPADAGSDDAVADSGYAAANKVSAGSTVDIGGTSFKVIGIVRVPQGGSPPDLYIPLGKAQAIGKAGTGGLVGDVNTVYVTADSAADVGAVQGELTRLLPSATVTDASDLASEATGSVSSAASLAGNLGKWLSVAVLAAAFGLAILLTMAAVTRRVREFGTLKALGWANWRIVVQVLGESVVIGITGGAAGVGLGYAGAALIDTLAPRLSEAVGGQPPATTAGSGVAGKLLEQVAARGTHTVYVTLTAPVTLSVILLAVLLALAGGLLAGAFGGWRAARLRPAAALAKVE